MSPVVAGGRGTLARLRAAAADAGALRAWTLVANDGIIATSGILEGFAGAGATNRTLITAATVATVAGMLGVGGAQWVEAAAERDAQLEAAREEAREIASRPDEEQAELVAYYEGKGLAPDLAREVAAQLMARDAVRAQLESEHGILEIASRSAALRLGVGAALAYGLGAAIPLLVTVATPVEIETGVILAAVLVSLTFTSIVGARAGRTDVSRTLARNLVIGMGTMGISYAVGRFVF